jgi:L-amino acid N-acyltransferase YncA
MGRVRIATRADVAASLAISNACAVDSAANFCIEPESFDDWEAEFDRQAQRFGWFVGVDAADNVTGFARGTPWQGRCAYRLTAAISIYLDPAARGKGHGKCLYEHLFGHLIAAGFHTLIAGITLPNPASIRLHESMGMAHVGTFPEVGHKFGHWHDVGYWQILFPTPD